MKGPETIGAIQQMVPWLLTGGMLVVFIVLGFVIVPGWPRHFQTQEQRIGYLQESIWCPICEGESVATSQTRESKVLREKIRSMVQSGKSNREIYDYVRRRYSGQQIAVPARGWLSRVSFGLPYLLIGILSTGIYWTVRHWVRRKKQNQTDSGISAESEQKIMDLVKSKKSPLE